MLASLLLHALAPAEVAAAAAAAARRAVQDAPAVAASATSQLGRRLPAPEPGAEAWLDPDLRPEATRAQLVVLTAHGEPTDAALARWRARFERGVLDVVAVAGCDDPRRTTLLARARAERIEHAVLFDDGRRARAWQVAAPPFAFVLDRDGYVVWEGSPGSRDAIDSALEHVTRASLRRDLDFDDHVERLRERLPHDGFHVVVEPPFVVVGDETADVVQRRARTTVRWAVDKLAAEFFDTAPDHVIDVWLFKDRASYERNTQRLFGERPFTPFGYYAARHRALIMNIATGGGTLVHEIVHPFVRADFPSCPAWFNEGLGSLFEQCEERDGRIAGMLNWRLPVLKKALGTDTAPALESLCGTTDEQFYGDDKGANYAAARYLCYWLQEHDLLRGYYKAFRANVATDPSGLRTLRAVLREDDIAAFERGWRRWVERL